MILEKLKIAYYMYKAKSLMNKKEYEKALPYLASINEKIIIEKGLYQCILYKAYCLYQVGYIDESLTCFSNSIDIINNSYSRNSISADDRDYLKEFVFLSIKEINKSFNNLKEINHLDGKIEKINFDITKVQNKIFFDFELGSGTIWSEEYNRRSKK